MLLSFRMWLNWCPVCCTVHLYSLMWYEILVWASFFPLLCFVSVRETWYDYLQLLRAKWCRWASMSDCKVVSVVYKVSGGKLIPTFSLTLLVLVSSLWSACVCFLLLVLVFFSLSFNYNSSNNNRWTESKQRSFLCIVSQFSGKWRRTVTRLEFVHCSSNMGIYILNCPFLTFSSVFDSRCLLKSAPQIAQLAKEWERESERWRGEEEEEEEEEEVEKEEWAEGKAGLGGAVVINLIRERKGEKRARSIYDY